MHRTESIDYGIVLAGDVRLVLDDGSETALAVGDVVVQRGTNHAWVNPGNEPARMAFVLVDARFSDELRELLGPVVLFRPRRRRVTSASSSPAPTAASAPGSSRSSSAREPTSSRSTSAPAPVGRRCSSTSRHSRGFASSRATSPTLPSVATAMDGVTHVVHLAALQYPYCRDDHLAGARVNVLGTVCVFDAALAAGARLVYASSIAALTEGQLYGTWKRANEGTAGAFWAEDSFPSIGIRPALVYGVGRDRGVTASMTLAMQAAARGEPHHVVHGGRSPLNHAGDVARLFVRCARLVASGAPVYDAGGRAHHVSEVVAAIQAVVPDAQVTFEDAPFAAIPESFDGSALEALLGGMEWRSLDDGVRETIERYRQVGRG